jgi:hypothetical protein
MAERGVDHVTSSSDMWFLDSVKRVLATGDRPVVSFGGDGGMRIVGCCNGSSMPGVGIRRGVGRISRLPVPGSPSPGVDDRVCTYERGSRVPMRVCRRMGIEKFSSDR